MIVFWVPWYQHLDPKQVSKDLGFLLSQYTLANGHMSIRGKIGKMFTVYYLWHCKALLQRDLSSPSIRTLGL